MLHTLGLSIENVCHLPWIEVEILFLYICLKYVFINKISFHLLFLHQFFQKWMFDRKKPLKKIANFRCEIHLYLQSYYGKIVWSNSIKYWLLKRETSTLPSTRIYHFIKRKSGMNFQQKSKPCIDDWVCVFHNPDSVSENSFHGKSYKCVAWLLSSYQNISSFIVEINKWQCFNKLGS